jgi:hypothetical protein
MAKAPPVPAAIMHTTTNLRTREAMMVGSHLEGGWYPPFPVGDQGTSFGPYQMHEGGALTSSGLTPSQAENPTRATKAMLAAYEDAVNQISEQLWSSNPEKASEESAFLAERPAVDYYSSQGAGAVNSAWTDTQDVLHGKKSQGGMPTNASFTSGPPLWEAIIEGISGNPTGLEQYAGNAATNNLGGLGGVWNFFSNPTDALERLGLIVFGAVIVIVGLVILATGTKAGKTVAAGATRGVSTRIGGTTSGLAADRRKRLALAGEANKIGERKLALKERREERLGQRQNVSRPAVGKHRKEVAA